MARSRSGEGILALLAILALPLLASPEMHHPPRPPLLLGGPLPDPACPYRAAHSGVSVLRLIGGAGKRGGRAAAETPKGGKRVAAKRGAQDLGVDREDGVPAADGNEVPAADGNETGAAAASPANKGKRSAKAALSQGEGGRRVKPRKSVKDPGDRPVVDGAEIPEGEAAEDASANEKMAAVNEGDAAGVAATDAAAEGKAPQEERAEGGGDQQATRGEAHRVPDRKGDARAKEELLGAAEVAAAQATHAALEAALQRLCGAEEDADAVTPLLPGGEGGGAKGKGGDGVREAMEAHLQAAR